MQNSYSFRNFIGKGILAFLLGTNRQHHVKLKEVHLETLPQGTFIKSAKLAGLGGLSPLVKFYLQT